MQIQNVDVSSNRDLFEKFAYPDGEFPNCSDMYLLFRKKDNTLQILLASTDISWTSNQKNILNLKNDGWKYDYFDSDIVEKEFDIK